jgi:hypothetical protein
MWFWFWFGLWFGADASVVVVPVVEKCVLSRHVVVSQCLLASDTRCTQPLECL